MSAPLKSLSLLDVLTIHELLLQTFGGMRGITEHGFGKIEAALGAPNVSMFGDDLYPELETKAAVLFHRLARAHGFTDGNKRVALVALLALLDRNGARIVADDDALYDLAMGAATDWTQQQIEGWVRTHVQPRVQFLEQFDVLQIRTRLAADMHTVIELTNPHGLQSALAAPRHSFWGEDAHPRLWDKAAALLVALIRNHPFHDANKRIAFAAVRLFLERNGWQLPATIDAIDIGRQIAMVTIAPAVVSNWLEANSIRAT